MSMLELASPHPDSSAKRQGAYRQQAMYAVQSSAVYDANNRAMLRRDKEQALSIARDSCSNIQCNAPGCDGTNSFLPDGRGQCFDGDCAGEPCFSICPSAQISCNQFGCAALYGGNDTAWTCSSGDYAGCPCDDSCPTTLPNCNDSACNGSSNAVDQYGICGSPLLSDCACINSCPSTPGPCSAVDCIGVNDPSGGASVCTAGSQLGCSCESSCPAAVACNDAQCQGYNNPINATNSFCTAGSYMGCRCTSVCGIANIEGAFGQNSCTANGCEGINNLDGSEFCTAGDFRGCHCSSACPSTPVSCSDATNCDGLDGFCTSGDAIGCACTGSLPSRKRWPTRSNVARTITPGPNARIPEAYYVCAPRGDSPFSAEGDTRSYPRQQIQQAINAAILLNYGTDPSNGVFETITGSNGREYPQRFYVRGPNAANFAIPNNNPQVNTNRLLEFPIIRNSAGDYVAFAPGMDPGPDRVVFDGATGIFAGVFTHRGELGNDFHRALGHNEEANSPSIPGLDFGPTILDADPFGWFTGSSGKFPMKRNPTLPAASFPTTSSGCPSSDGQCYCYNTVTVLGWYPRDAATQAIEQACSDWSGQSVPVSSSSTDIQSLSTTKQITYNNTVWSIEMSVWQTLLVSSAGSTIDQQSCTTALTSAMDNCQTDTTTEKIGGEYILHISGVGSQQYNINPGVGNPAPPASSDDQQPFDTRKHRRSIFPSSASRVYTPGVLGLTWL